MKHHNVAIIGLGWLGEALAVHLMARGRKVYGTTTSEEKAVSLQSRGMVAEQWKYTGRENRLPAWISICSTVVITLPPRGDHDNWHSAIRYILNQCAPGSLVLFTSTTGVYRQGLSAEIRVAKESCPLKPGPLLAAEEVVRSSGLSYLILRLAGLVGGERIPARFLSGKTDVTQPDAPVNLIHREDIVGYMEALLDAGIRNELFNICSPEHPSRKVFYTSQAIRSNLPPPVFRENEQDTPYGYIVDDSKIRSAISYSMKYPDPMNF